MWAFRKQVVVFFMMFHWIRYRSMGCMPSRAWLIQPWSIYYSQKVLILGHCNLGWNVLVSYCRVEIWAYPVQQFFNDSEGDMS